MGQTNGNGLTRFINSRKHIHQFAVEYAQKYGLQPSEVEKDIIQAKKYNHISFKEYELLISFKVSITSLAKR